MTAIIRIPSTITYPPIASSWKFCLLMYSNAALCETLVSKSLNHTLWGFHFCKLQSVYRNEIQSIFRFVLEVLRVQSLTYINFRREPAVIKYPPFLTFCLHIYLSFNLCPLFMVFLSIYPYLTKTLNHIIFFSSTNIRIFFSATLGIRIFFLEK
jgi:hypothetical protein